MSHELRTPLNAILGFAQLLGTTRTQVGNREEFEQILRAGRHLLTLINEVLDISRIESGNLALSLEPVRAGYVLEEVLEMLVPQAGSRQITLQAGSDIRSELCVQADQQRLKQVLINLLSNAIKYNRVGGSVTVYIQEVHQDSVRLQVTDTGLGIPKERLHLLFSPFERLGADNTGVEGAGIGLALVKGLVEAMGGTIHVESQLNVGTSFWVDLQRCSSSRSTTGELGASQPSSNIARPAVLCIEDNPSNLLLIEHILAQQPLVRLVTALEGKTGLALARDHRPKLVLLDVHLPDMDGIDVLQELKSDAETASIPVVRKDDHRPWGEPLRR